MTPARRDELQHIMDGVIGREVANATGVRTPEDLAKHITDLCQIWVCISTAYELLSGEAYKRLGDAVIAASVRGGGK
jgi:hypothetical protein